MNNKTTVIVDKVVSDGEYFILTTSERLTEEQLWEIRKEMNRTLFREEFTKRFMVGQAFGL